LHQLTWHQITESDGCHGDETKVEAIEEGPIIFPKQKKTSSSGQVNAQKANGQNGIEPGLANKVGELWFG